MRVQASGTFHVLGIRWLGRAEPLPRISKKHMLKTRKYAIHVSPRSTAADPLRRTSPSMTSNGSAHVSREEQTAHDPFSRSCATNVPRHGDIVDDMDSAIIADDAVDLGKCRHSHCRRLTHRDSRTGRDS